MKKKWPYMALALVSFAPSLVQAAELGIDGTTIFRFEQRAFPGFAKQTIVPATQFLGADLDKLGDGNLSLHLYGWGRVDLADRSTAEKDTDGDLSYGYLNYRFPAAKAEIKAGRFFINEGVAAEQVDGVSARTSLKEGFALVVFGGAPVKLDRDSNSKGDFIAGGRGSYRLNGVLEVGVSGLHEGNVTVDPVLGRKLDRELVGGDLWFSPDRHVELSGHTFYNTATSGLAEHSYLLILKPHKAFSVSGTYNEDKFKNYFTYTNLHSLFNPDNDGELKSYGAGVTWTGFAPAEVTADYKRFNRSSNVALDSNGNSNRYGAGLRLTLLDNKVRSGFAYHRVDGSDSFNAYHEVRGFGQYNSGRYAASLDAIGQFYRDSIFNKKEAFEVIASTGYRLLPELALSGELSYGQNPRLTEDLRGVLRLTFNYLAASKGANK
jgi:hypothetical protein